MIFAEEHNSNIIPRQQVMSETGYSCISTADSVAYLAASTLAFLCQVSVFCYISPHLTFLKTHENVLYA